MHPAFRRLPIRLLMLEVLATTLTVTNAKWLSEPLTPCTSRVKEVGSTEGATFTVSGADAGNPLAGVIEPKDAVTPTAGAPVTLSVTGELKPLSAVRLTVEDPDPPRPRLRGEVAVSEKSGWFTSRMVMSVFSFCVVQFVVHVDPSGPCGMIAQLF